MWGLWTDVSELQAEITRLMEQAQATEEYNRQYQAQLKKMSQEGDQNEYTLKTVTQMHEALVSEMRKVSFSSILRLVQLHLSACHPMIHLLIFHFCIMTWMFRILATRGGHTEYADNASRATEAEGENCG